MKPSDKLVKRIMEEQPEPVQKWRYVFKNKSVWIAFSLAVVLGALSFSVILFAIQQTDFDIISHMSHSPLELLLGLLPFLWIIFLIISILVAMYTLRFSRKGYKFTFTRLVGYSAALSILVGTIFFISGGARKLEQAFAIHVSIYQSIQEKKILLWSMPEEGYLAGEIENVEMNSLLIKDFEGKSWIVYYKDAFIPPVVLLERNEIVKLIGHMDNDREFTASEVRPWGGRRYGRNNRMPGR
jgi:hypothetical protein